MHSEIERVSISPTVPDSVLGNTDAQEGFTELRLPLSGSKCKRPLRKQRRASSPVFKGLPTMRQSAFKIWGSVLIPGLPVTCSLLCYNGRSGSLSGLAGLDEAPLVQSLRLKPQLAVPDMTQHLTWTQLQPPPCPGSRQPVSQDQAKITEFPVFLRKILLLTGTALPEILQNASASTFKPWLRVSCPHGFVLPNFMIPRWNKFMSDRNIFSPVTCSSTQVYSHQKR